MQRRKCLICDKTAVLVACSAACPHPAVSCQACLTQHVEARFSAYGLQPVPCIAQSCKILLTETEVASNMSMEARARFSERTFNAMMQHEDNFVRCAASGALQALHAFAVLHNGAIPEKRQNCDNMQWAAAGL